MRNYGLTVGQLQVLAGQDPELASLLAQTSGMDELDALDAAASGDLTAILSGDGGLPAGVNQQAMIQQLLARSAVLTGDYRPNKGREYPIGFGPVVVGAGLIGTITVQPQIVFRPERLIVPSDIAGQFDLVDIIVGKNPQMAATGPIAARTFDEQSVGVRLRMDTCQISQQIILRAQNTGGAPATFRATMIGTAVE
jgi:hypothetical protein